MVSTFRMEINTKTNRISGGGQFGIDMIHPKTDDFDLFQQFCYDPGVGVGPYIGVLVT